MRHGGVGSKVDVGYRAIIMAANSHVNWRTATEFGGSRTVCLAGELVRRVAPPKDTSGKPAG
jgi:hypothetical protein